MNNTFGVTAGQCAEHLADVPDYLGKGADPHLAWVPEGATLQVFHVDHQVVLDSLEGVHMHDVGVTEVGDGAGLLAKPGFEALPRGEFVVQYLEGYLAPQRRVLGEINHAHAAASQRAPYAVLAKR